MVNKFLNAKHWQLFTLMFGIPMVLQLVIMTSVVLNIDPNGTTDPSTVFSSFWLFPFIMLLYAGTYFSWFWAIGVGLQKYVPSSISMKVKRFKIFFFIPLIYLFFAFVLMGTTFYGIFLGNGFTGNLLGTLLVIIIPLHLFAMFCICYLLYFVSKTLKTVELKREVSLGDFIGEFFMIWFFPIGIWFLQPRINKIGSQEEVGLESS